MALTDRTHDAAIRTAVEATSDISGGSVQDECVEDDPIRTFAALEFSQRTRVVAPIPPVAISCFDDLS
jgi:hypothetical protein